jgi:hypothetical protein
VIPRLLPRRRDRGARTPRRAIERGAGDDPIKCPVCTRSQCVSAPCDEAGPNADCILCPGQSPEDLPDTCDSNECPDGHQVCSDTVACPPAQYCSNGCCIDPIVP